MGTSPTHPTQKMLCTHWRMLHIPLRPVGLRRHENTNGIVHHARKHLTLHAGWCSNGENPKNQKNQTNQIKKIYKHVACLASPAKPAVATWSFDERGLEFHVHCACARCMLFSNQQAGRDKQDSYLNVMSAVHSSRSCER